MKKRESLVKLALYRRRNLRILRVCLIMLVCVLPVFMFLDYFLKRKTFGEDIALAYLYTDIGQFVFNGILLLVSIFAVRFSKRFVDFLFFLMGSFLIINQIFLLYYSQRQATMMLFLQILVFALIYHAPLLRNIGILLVNIGMTSVLAITNTIPVSDLGTQLVGIFIGSVLLIFIRNFTVKQTLEIRERGIELAKEKRVVEVVKNRQDGDYFLTTLLLEPLGSCINRKNSNVVIQSFIKQKKEFEFRNKRYELGGDLCFAAPVQLRGKSYSVFLNADAMGKSIQGAGGALVFGAVFHAIAARSELTETMRDMWPEKWLHSAITELQSVFVSFAGSMLVSVLLGLIDEETGFVYFINAEHPYPILFRDQKAQLILPDESLFKLGVVQSMVGRSLVNTLQLQKGDVLLIGSDGKDDVVVNDNDNSNEKNNDESLILKYVTKAEGDCSKVYEMMNKELEFIDDFSLLSIYFSPYEEYLPPVLKTDTIKNLWKKGDYKILSSILASHIEKSPGDLQSIMQASQTFRKLGDFKQSIDLGERVRLRNRQSVANLVNLAQAYIMAENPERSLMIIDEALALDPNHRTALAVKEQLRAKV